MVGRVYEVDYFGSVLVSRHCSDAALQWVARDLSCRTQNKFVLPVETFILLL